MERTPMKCCSCGSEYHMIANFPESPRDNKKWRKEVCVNEKGNRACDNGENNRDQKIYAFMACMSSNKKRMSSNDER